jgi:hypothetical protein
VQSLQTWNERLACNSASPSLRRKYDNLVLQPRIQELQQHGLLITVDDLTVVPNSVPITVEQPAIGVDGDLIQSRFNEN